ncbi:MAG TPA: glycosyltransferase family 4 protein [Bryobacteraceae bacterium]|nr:glycosyltransferase family 4 protein [Bryobacteraceae bacterium]
MFSKAPRGGRSGAVAMHVVYLITRGDAVGGATIHVRDLARVLIRSGNRATVLAGGAGEAYQEFQRHGIPCEVIPALRRSIHPLRDAAALVRIVAALRRLRPDLVSAHTAKAGLLGRVAAKIAGVPCLFTAHGWSIGDRVSRAGGLIFTLAERLAAPLAARIVNVCQAEQDLAARRGIGPMDRFEVIHNGVHDVPPDLRAHPETEPPHLITVARFEPPKDQALQLEALSRLRDIPWSLEFIGAGPLLEQAKRRAWRLGLENRVLFSGSSTNVAERLSQAQLFVLSSRSEGFPRGILEAMRAGLPVVATDVGGVAEAVIPETGLLVPRGDAGALAGALRRLIADPDLRARMGRAARARYQRHFTFSMTCAKTFDLYQRLLGAAIEQRVPAGEQV